VPQDQRTEVERWFDAQPRTIVPVGDTGGAAVVVVKFNDFQCPPCRQTYVGYKPILAKYEAQAPGKVLFITKDFPIDPECNANTPGGGHVLACEAAVAVRLARANHREEKLEDWIFANQQTLTADALKQAARDLGGVTDFEAKYSQALEQVKTDIALGKLLGVSATPTFFINGVKVSGGLQPQYFDTILAYEISKAAKR
jgi:protein-disulfide isomerase